MDVQQGPGELEIVVLPNSVYEVADQFAIVGARQDDGNDILHVQFGREIITTESSEHEPFVAKRQRRVFATISMTAHSAQKLYNALGQALSQSAIRD